MGDAVAQGKTTTRQQRAYPEAGAASLRDVTLRFAVDGSLSHGGDFCSLRQPSQGQAVQSALKYANKELKSNRKKQPTHQICDHDILLGALA